MAQAPDYYFKLLCGDLTARLAMAMAEIEKLKEDLAALKDK